MNFFFPILKDNLSTFFLPILQDNFRGFFLPILQDNLSTFFLPILQDNFRGFFLPILQDNFRNFFLPILQDNFRGFFLPILQDNFRNFFLPILQDNFRGFPCKFHITYEYNFFFSFQIKDIKGLHQHVCPNFQPTIDLSLDGIQEAKSSALSVDVYSISFKQCRTVYPVKIIRPINKYKMDDQIHFKSVLDDINENQCHLENAIGDNPKRSGCFRCALSSSSTYACEYCTSKAVYWSEEGKKGHLTWPYSTSEGSERTIEDIIEITDKIKSGENVLTKDEKKGFWGVSHLLKQENFHFINSVRVEYMHSGCIGIVKRLVQLTFNTGENRERRIKRKLSDVSKYNTQISLVKAPHESSRRLRNLDLGVMKAQELRNIILIYFPLVINCIPNTFPREKKIWFQLTYVLRACTLPNKQFNEISNKVIEETALAFYKNFEYMFGQKNCTYSVHVVSSHILQIRGDQPLTETSAFKYENFYSELRNLFQAGTISPTKQILRNCYMKRQLEKHACERKIFYDIEKKGKENNSLVYYVDDENEHKIFQIIKKIDENNFICNPQGRYNYKCDLLSHLDWGKVGVFKAGPFSHEEIKLERRQIEGKVIRVDNLFITCSNNILREQ